MSSATDQTTYVDVTDHLRRISFLVNTSSPVLAPPLVAEWLSNFCSETQDKQAGP
jgi:hypothetical protein